MTIAMRLNLAFALSATLLALLVSVAVALHDYRLQVDALKVTSQSSLLAQPTLPLRLQLGSRPALERLAAGLLQDAGSPVSSATVYDSSGEILAFASLSGAPRLAANSLDHRRGSALTTDASLQLMDAAGRTFQPGLFTSLVNGLPPVYFTLPIFSLVDPGVHAPDEKQLLRALLNPRSEASNWVVGYLSLGADSGQMVSAALAAGGRLFALSLAVIALCGTLFFTLTRRITRPLRQISAAAERIAAGDIGEEVRIEGVGEIGDVARVINNVLGDVRSFKFEQEFNQRRLALKVEERSNQISERDAALSKAARKAERRRVLMRRLTNYDHLTRLPNRQLFTEQLALLLRLSLRNSRKLALLFVNIEGYRRINDSLGIRAGDLVLREVAKRLTATVRDSDSIGHFFRNEEKIAVSRLGGDEFAVVLNEVDSKESTVQVARRIVETLAEPIRIDGNEVVLKPGIGIAMAPLHGVDVETLLRAASVAKLHAGKDGAEQVVFYKREMSAVGERRLRLESDLRRAIERDELSLHYQPQVDTLTGSVVGAEALLRWEHPELGLVPPRDFIRLAEETGVMEALGDWVLVESCKQVRAFLDAGLKLPKVAINVSALQFDQAFVRRISAVVAQQGIRPSQLELALSESIMTSNDSETAQALDALKRSGVYLSVDDFGTGYSPLGYLGEYPLDELKLDRKFLLQADRSDNGAKLVIAIIAMARSLGLRVLATGVETAGQLRFLNDNGAHLIQGYLFSEPVPADQLEHMLRPWHFLRQVQELATADQR